MRFKDAIIISYPLGGKGTQSNFLKDFYEKCLQDYLYIATGNYFRGLSNNNHSAVLLHESVNIKGELAPDFMATGLVVDNLVQNLDEGKTLIFDGFPRNKKQGEAFVEIMEFYQRKPVIILIKVSKEEIMKRLPVRKGEESRQDDTEEAVDNRLKIFDQENNPLLEYLKEHFECYEIDGNDEPEVIHQRIVEVL